MFPDEQALRDSVEAVEVVELLGPTAPEDVLLEEPEILVGPAGPLDAPRTIFALRQLGKPPIALERLLDRLALALNGHRHEHVRVVDARRRDLAARVLGMAVVANGANRSTLETLQAFEQMLVKAQVHLWAATALPARSAATYTVGDFCYGRTDLGRLETLCQTAGSNYFLLYGDRFADVLCVSRIARAATIIDTEKVATLAPHEAPRLLRLFEAYYGILAAAERPRFLADLDRQQAIYSVAGLGTVNAEFLNWFTRIGHVEWICVFQRDPLGWVTASREQPRVDVARPEAYLEGSRRITAALALDDWRARPLDEYLQRFCEYVDAAGTMDAAGRQEEALLHLVFALDLLLGGERGEALTTILAQRTALVAHRALPKLSFDDIVQFIDQCYELRSGYAHRGQRGAMDGGHAEEDRGRPRRRPLLLSDRTELLERICRVVFAAGSYVRRQPWAQSPDARRDWMGRLDILRQKRQAKLPETVADIEELGLGLDRIVVSDDELPRVRVRFTES